MKKFFVYLFCILCGSLFMSQGYALERETSANILNSSMTQNAECQQQNIALQQQNIKLQAQIVTQLWVQSFLGLGFLAVLLALVGEDSRYLGKLIELGLTLFRSVKDYLKR